MYHFHLSVNGEGTQPSVCITLCTGPSQGQPWDRNQFVIWCPCPKNHPVSAHSLKGAQRTPLLSPRVKSWWWPGSEQHSQWNMFPFSPWHVGKHTSSPRKHLLSASPTAIPPFPTAAAHFQTLKMCPIWVKAQS